jgi:hypothetical protein
MMNILFSPTLARVMVHGAYHNSLFFVRLLRRFCRNQQMVHGGVCSRTSDASLFALRAQHWSCRQMVHGVFALMNHLPDR